MFLLSYAHKNGQLGSCFPVNIISLSTLCWFIWY